jgi:DNA replication and repair protein RecF
VGTAAAVFILPEDIELTAGPSAYHRQFLDLYISQFSRRYLDDLITYRKVLLQRNKLLKDISRSHNGISQLAAWDKLLIEHGTRITGERQNFVQSISESSRRYYEHFDKATELALQYKPKIEADQTDIKTAMESHLDIHRQREIRAGVTLVGPHRDKLEMDLNGKSVRHYGSRGQKRCVMLAMKLAVADLLSELKEEKVMLILDEIFSELDNAKSLALMEALSGYKQVFMATAGEFDFKGLPVRKFHVESGKIKEA